MARLWTAGGETKDNLAEGKLAAAGTGTLTYDATSARSGGACYKFDSGASLQIYREINFAGVLDTTYFLRVYVYLESSPNDAVTPIRVISAFSANLLSLRWNAATSTFKLWSDRNAVQIGSDSPTIALNTWHRLELEIRSVTGGGLTGTGKARLNGVEFAATTTTDYGAASHEPSFLRFGWTATGAGTSKVIRFDDLAVNDATGADQNSYPGDGKVVLLLPTADSARATLWTGGAGGTTNLFDAVNNTPPIGNSTETNLTQIEHAGGAAGTTDAYDATLATYTAAGLVSGDTVTLVRPIACTGEDAASGTKNLSFQVLSNPVVASTGSFDVAPTSGALGVHPAGWFYKAGPVVYAPSVTLGTAPVLRLIRPETAAGIASVEFLGLVVEYAAAVSGGATGTAAADALTITGTAVTGTAVTPDTGTVAADALTITGTSTTGTAGTSATGSASADPLMITGTATTGTIAVTGIAAADPTPITGTAATGTADALATTTADTVPSTGTLVTATTGQGVTGTATSDDVPLVGTTTTATAGQAATATVAADVVPIAGTSTTGTDGTLGQGGATAAARSVGITGTSVTGTAVQTATGTAAADTVPIVGTTTTATAGALATASAGIVGVTGTATTGSTAATASATAAPDVVPLVGTVTTATAGMSAGATAAPGTIPTTGTITTGSVGASATTTAGAIPLAGTVVTGRGLAAIEGELTARLVAKRVLVAHLDTTPVLWAQLATGRVLVARLAAAVVLTATVDTHVALTAHLEAA